MLVAVSSMVIPKLTATPRQTSSTTEHGAYIPEDIGGRAVVPLQDFRSKVQLVTFPLKGALLLSPKGVFSDRPRPERRHTEVAYLETTFVSDEDVRRLQIQMNNAGTVDEVQAL